MLNDYVTFGRAMQHESRAVVTLLREGPQKVTCFEWDVDIEGDPIMGMSNRDLAKLAVRLLFWSIEERAERLVIDYCANRIWLVRKVGKLEVAAPPAPALVDLVRALLRSSRVKPGRTGAIDIPTLDGTRRITLGLTWEDDNPCLCISGLDRNEQRCHPLEEQGKQRCQRQ